MIENTLSEFLSVQDYIGIQMEQNGVGHFEVQARVNGIPARLIIDTGASHTVVARDVVDRFNIEITESDTLAGGVGTSGHAVAYGIIESLEIQSFTLFSFRVGVIDLSHVNQSLEAHGAGRVEGVIGGDLMSSRSAVIDYQHATLYLHSNETVSD